MANLQALLLALVIFKACAILSLVFDALTSLSKNSLLLKSPLAALFK